MSGFAQQMAATHRRLASMRAATAFQRDRAGLARSAALELPPLIEWIPQLSPELAAPRHLQPVLDAFERIHRGERVELLRFFDLRDLGSEVTEAAIETSAGQHVTARWRCGEPLSVCTGGVCVEPLVPPPSPVLRGVEYPCP